MTGAQELRRQLGTARAGDLTLSEYEEFVRRSDRADMLEEGPGFALLGLYGETGSLLSALKRRERDGESDREFVLAALEEIGDSLWYLVNSAHRSGLTLREVVGVAVGAPAVSTIVDIDRASTPSEAPSRYADLLLQLAVHTGRFLADSDGGRLLSINRHGIVADLAAILVNLAHAARMAGCTLDEAANANILKVLSRWPIAPIEGALFDERFDIDEQIPRTLTMHFRERKIGARTVVIQECNGIKVGDPITDNRRDPDGYRFHDVFHLSYAACLGWSPVLRALLRLKRKSNPPIDENEDGARAIIVEEAVAALAFNHSRNHDFFRRTRRLEYTLLKAIARMVDGYEVESRPLWQWERAILQGFHVFHEVKDRSGGAVHIDLVKRSISYGA